MILKLENGSEIQVKFMHYPDVPMTIAEIEYGWGGLGFLQGTAFCREGDQFNKAIGRKIALKRAIQRLPRAFRTLIWKAYFAYVNDAGKRVRQ